MRGFGWPVPRAFSSSGTSAERLSLTSPRAYPAVAASSVSSSTTRARPRSQSNSLSSGSASSGFVLGSRTRLDFRTTDRWGRVVLICGLHSASDLEAIRSASASASLAGRRGALHVGQALFVPVLTHRQSPLQLIGFQSSGLSLGSHTFVLLAHEPLDIAVAPSRPPRREPGVSTAVWAARHQALSSEASARCAMSRISGPRATRICVMASSAARSRSTSRRRPSHSSAYAGLTIGVVLGSHTFV